MRIARPLVVAALLLLVFTLADANGQRREARRSEDESHSFDKKADRAYLFAYFKGNGEDGLHLAYSDDGLVWHQLNDGNSLLRPVVGKDKLMRDPNITLGPDGLFHLVWTSSWHEPLIGHATSKDLIHWSEQQAIAPMTEEPNAQNVWAPETFYDADEKQFLLFWATTIPGRFPETDKSGDNGLNHRIYITMTKDFKSFTPTRLFFDPGFNVIDATIVRDDGRFIMFFKDETKQPVAQKNIHYAVAERAVGPFGKVSPSITGKYWAEGPTVIKIDGRWIVYFDRYKDHRYGA
ncbi:MAG TPA: glycoside hydrolase family 43 protein, partial [Pyrinomonadaceae bacterium]|nr:glycoside hydrolase family 43 protein [Pyrinomonadaceae bacterium]